MKARLTLFLFLLPVAAACAADQTGQPAPAATFPAQVSEIANAPILPLKEKEERISSAVQVAVTSAIAELKDPAEILQVALKFARAAATAAPQFTDAITRAFSAIPSITAIDGAANQIQAAVVDAATKAAATAFLSHRPKAPQNPEFGGNTADTVVSRYR
jgi:hypothetical protein